MQGIIDLSKEFVREYIQYVLVKEVGCVTVVYKCLLGEPKNNGWTCGCGWNGCHEWWNPEVNEWKHACHNCIAAT